MVVLYCFASVLTLLSPVAGPRSPLSLPAPCEMSLKTSRADIDGSAVGRVPVGCYRWLFWELEVGLPFGDDFFFGFGVGVDGRLW